MILAGILHYSLGGFGVIRGVAPLGELARCSTFDPEYQRNLIKTHRDEINRFLDDKQYLFFPEVILSALLRFDFSIYKGTRAIDPLGNIFEGKGFTSNINGLSVKVVKTKPQTEIGAPQSPVIAYIELPEEQLGNNLKLFRIDGNHRLSAADDAKPGEARYQLETPFCIVLHSDESEAQRFEKVVFHNINAKQIPLTSEENLRLILEESENQLFDDKTLLENRNFGPAYYLARKVLADIDDRYLSALTKALENRRSLSLGLTQFLVGRDEALGKAQTIEELEVQVVRLRNALKAVNEIFERRPTLRESGCHGVLVAFLYFALHNEGLQLQAFERWVISNRIDYLVPSTTSIGLGYHYHLGRIQAIDAASLVSVFTSILLSRHREIFISMAFKEQTKETYLTIEKTVNQINEKHKLDIKINPIRIDLFSKGHSYTIDDEILKIIEGTGLLIADLTSGNRNVYHEIGYLMGLNRGNRFEQENFILIANKNDPDEESLEKDIGFNLKSWQQLRFISTRDLEERLTNSIEIYYKL